MTRERESERERCTGDTWLLVCESEQRGRVHVLLGRVLSECAQGDGAVV